MVIEQRNRVFLGKKNKFFFFLFSFKKMKTFFSDVYRNKPIKGLWLRFWS